VGFSKPALSAVSPSETEFHPTFAHFSDIEGQGVSRLNPRCRAKHLQLLHTCANSGIFPVIFVNLFFSRFAGIFFGQCFPLFLREFVPLFGRSVRVA